MPYLKHRTERPSADDLTQTEMRFIAKHFQISDDEFYIEGTPVLFDQIDEVEVVKAPSVNGFMGFFVRQFVGTDRYHVGVYFSKHYEAVLPNVSRNIARHVVQEIAYFATNPVRYTGQETLSSLTDQ